MCVIPVTVFIIESIYFFQPITIAITVTGINGIPIAVTICGIAISSTKNDVYMSIIMTSAIYIIRANFY